MMNTGNVSSLRKKCLAGSLLLPALLPGIKAQVTPEKPNVVFIFVDDFASSGLKVYAGNDSPADLTTPNTDKLAAEGMMFTDAYVTPQCTPSRASLITGQYTARNKMWHVTPRYGCPYALMAEPPYIENMPRETYTLPKALKDNNYKTGIFGKWHLSQWCPIENNPDGQYVQLFADRAHHYGFDVTDSSEIINSAYHKKSDKGVDFLTDKTIDFIRENKDTTFFAYLSHHTLHNPIMAPQSLVNKYIGLGYSSNVDDYNSAHYLASIEHLDNAVGRLVDSIDAFGLTNNTLIMYMTDNGGLDHLYDSKPLREGKGAPYEGGIRVPFIAKCPGFIPAGTINNSPVHIIDIYPTLLELAGGNTSRDWTLDGLSLVNELNQTGSITREALYWWQPLYDMVQGATPSACIRKGKYKLVWHLYDYFYRPENQQPSKDKKDYSIGEVIELFDLEADISEANNLAATMPGKVEELKADILQWLEDNYCQMPFPNPDYDPNNPVEVKNGNSIVFPPFIQPHDRIFNLTENEEFFIDFDNYISLNPDEDLVITCTQMNGDPLPAGIEYDFNNQRITGTPTTNGIVNLKFTIEGKKYTIIDSVKLDIAPDADPRSSEKNILTYSFAEQTGDAIINPANATIAVEVENGAPMASLVATFTISDLASMKIGTVDQVSATTANDFTSPVVYTVTAEDGSTKDWTVTVTEEPYYSNEKEIITFSIPNQVGETIIDKENHTISIVMPAGTSLNSLIPEFTLSESATASIGATVQESGVDKVDFSSIVTYTTTAEDGSTRDWFVDVSVVDAIKSLTLEDIKVFPNPARGQISIQIEAGNLESVSVELLDNMGRIIYSKDTSIQDTSDLHISFPLGGYSVGIYYARVKAGNAMVTKPFVKK